MNCTTGVTDNSTFLYFAYGSNLLSSRIHIQNPTAIFHAVARLDDYRLDFDYSSVTWHGAAATITESMNEHVWGVVWLIRLSELANLDNQEGVSNGIYKRIQVNVTTLEGKQLCCESYYMLRRGSPDRRPSPHYLEVILRGAVQHGLPDSYIEGLRKIEHNGYAGPLPLFDDIMTRHGHG
jgi:gamma-glutamylcyclotransferase